MIYAGDTEEEQTLKLELLQRILCRKLKNSEIYNLKTGFMAFIENCIQYKKSLNLFQVLSKAYHKRLYAYSSLVYTSFKYLKGAAVLQKTMENKRKRKAMQNMKNATERWSRVEKGLSKVKRVFLGQSLVKQFLDKLKRMNDDRSSTSLLVPVQHKSITETITKDELTEG